MDLESRLAELEKTVKLLKDKDEIRDVLARASLAGDRGDVEALGACFHPDAYDKHLPFFEGSIQTLLEYFRQNGSSLAERTQYTLGTTLIEVDGDSARSQCYAWSGKLLYESNEDGVRLTRLSGMRYLDRLERRNGEWRISHRTFVPEWGVNIPVPTESVGIFKIAAEQERPGIISKRDKTDISYSF